MKPALCLAALVASCATPPLPMSRFELMAGRKPEVEYFFSPSCRSCEKGPSVIARYQEVLGRVADFQYWCSASEENPDLDRTLCLEQYRRNADAGIYRMTYLGQTQALPAVFVNGRLARNDAEVCSLLGYDEDCLLNE